MNSIQSLLESAKKKLTGGKKESKEVEEALYDLDPTSTTDKPVVATSSAAKGAITRAGGKEIPGTKDAR